MKGDNVLLLQDSRISVEAMLQSPYVGDIQSEAEEWCSALREIEEITDLWSTCQKKVVDWSTLQALSVLVCQHCLFSLSVHGCHVLVTLSWLHRLSAMF